MSVAQAPDVQAVLDVAGTEVRKLMTEGSAAIVVWPDNSVETMPVPGIRSFELRNARWSDPVESHTPLVACQMNSGIESTGKDVTPGGAVQLPEQFTTMLCPTVSVPALAR